MPIAAAIVVPDDCPSVLTPHTGGLIADVIARAVGNIENFLAGRPAELLLDPRW